MYPEFLRELYAAGPGLADRSYDEQLRRLLDTGFGHADAYSEGMGRLGVEAIDVIADAEILQLRWAEEHDLSLPDDPRERLRRIVAAQVAHHRPDILYVFEWSPLGDAFLAEAKRGVRLLVGQVASPLPPNRTYAAYDLMISSYPPLVEHFRRRGKRAEHVKLGFDERILETLPPHLADGVRSREESGVAKRRYDVTFIGGFAPSHTDRVAWLERVLREVSVDVFGYGIARVPEQSIIRRHFRGPAWGRTMYDVLRASRITLNLHARIDAAGEVLAPAANNMRLFEATGVGTCLLTDDRPNLADLFTPDREVLTFRDSDECVEKLRHHLADEPARRTIAEAGHARTLREHTYRRRMTELLAVLERHLTM